MKLIFENLRKHFEGKEGGVDAIKNIDLEVEDGEFFILLGPSGCGKSTLLNLVAGLEKPTSGRILFGDEEMAAPEKRLFVPPRDRNVAMVFQNYALYPHMKVFDNIAFPLKVAKMASDEIEESVRNTATMLGIEDLLDRKPGELSGGQRQRVAISRALVRRPRVFLLDEPLSNLDAQLRTSTRAELKELQNELGITTLYVTHDQTEAMTLGDRVALLRGGELVQVGAPEELYHTPVSPFVATFIGSPPMNLIDGQKKGGHTVSMEGIEFELPEKQAEAAGKIDNDDILVGIRPEKVRVSTSEPEETEGDGGGRRLTLKGELTTVEPLGREILYHVGIDCCEMLALSEEMDVERGEEMYLSFQAEDLHLFDAESMDQKTREQMQSGLSKENREKIKKQSRQQEVTQ